MESPAHTTLTIVYALMQAVGIVDDHARRCFGRAQETAR
jgi:3-methyladenine DNA glycosylase Tag